MAAPVQLGKSARQEGLEKRWRGDMAKYTVHLFCVDCWQLHRMAAGIDIDEAAEEFAKLKEVYRGKPMPAHIVDLLNQRVTCPTTGNDKADPDKVYIIRRPS
jgi:hypothetical protein